MKKVISIALVLMMALTMASTAFAAEGDLTGASIKGVTASPSTGAATFAALVPVAVPMTSTVAEGNAPTAFTVESTDQAVIMTFADAATADFAGVGTFASGTALTDGATTALPIDTVVVVEVEKGSDSSKVYYAFVITDSAAGGGGGSGDDPTSGNSAIDGDGSLDALDTTVYEMTIPTAKSLNFTLDPQGLAAIEENGEMNLDDLVGGAILANASAHIINLSTGPVTLSLKLKAVDSDESGNGITFATTADAVDATVAKNVLLYAVPSTADQVANDTEYAAAEKAFPVTAAESIVKYVIAPTKFKVTDTDGVKELVELPNTSHGIAIQMGGIVNKDADWTAYAGDSPDETVKVEAVFDWTASTADDEDLPLVEGIPHLVTPLDSAVDVVTIEGGNGGGNVDPNVVGFTSRDAASPTNWVITKDMISGDAFSMPFNFGPTNLTIKSITRGTNNNPYAVNTAYTKGTNSIEWSASTTTAFKGAAADIVAKITLSDGSVFNFTIKA